MLEFLEPPLKASQNLRMLLTYKAMRLTMKNGGVANKKGKKQTSKLSNTYTNKVDKKTSTPYLLKKKK